MSWLPKSPKARRRLTLVAAIAPVLALAVGLTLWGLRDSISFFYTPSQAAAASPDDPAGWVQLVRAYAVLGDTAKRDAALKDARARYAGKPDVLAELAKAAATEPMK